MNNPKFQMFKSRENNQYYYRLKANNGEIILSSEGYLSKHACEKGLLVVRTNAPNPLRYQRKNTVLNYTFNLKAANGEIVGRSENYISEYNRDNGIRAVMRNAPHAPTEDLT